ncbi:hypothetical protein [Bradyrhizobium sp. LMTR 3]|uniref:hypothetical protein n=1 Tax=Bradyrhizobium sp. LMTR 3 TaxID=189873 RepID=UPI00114684A3|nr:hypothetical protein [Bradyrhizobium sp. LMTR 3]
MNKLETSCCPKGEPEGLSDWYEIYPRKKQRKDAAKAFGKVIRDKLIALPLLNERTGAFAAGWAQRPARDRQFIPYPASWLNKGGCEDDGSSGDGCAVPAPPTIDPRSFTPVQWRARLREADETGVWREVWGPEPGKPGMSSPPAFDCHAGCAR